MAFESRHFSSHGSLRTCQAFSTVGGQSQKQTPAAPERAAGIYIVHAAGFEPATFGSGDRRSNPLSYACNGSTKVTYGPRIARVLGKKSRAFGRGIGGLRRLPAAFSLHYLGRRGRGRIIVLSPVSPPAGRWLTIPPSWLPGAGLGARSEKRLVPCAPAICFMFVHLYLSPSCVPSCAWATRKCLAC